MRLLRRLFAAVLLLAFASGTAVAADLAAFAAARGSISSRDIQRHVEVLASDTFEGREAGSRGGQAAAAYIVNQLRQWKTAPGGAGNDFFQDFPGPFRNVLAVIPGSDPALKDEVVLVGGHYDHVGYGTANNSRGGAGSIHNGADDNASGTAILLELAQAFSVAELRPKRTVLLAFWDAEEKGLLGSRHWIGQPTVPLANVRLALNLDMVGRLRNETIEVYGIRSGRGMRRFVAEQNRESDLGMQFTREILADSDHYPLLESRVPSLMLHTGKHEDYHRSSDDPHTVNFAGAERVGRLIFHLVHAAAERADLPEFRAEVFQETREEPDAPAGMVAEASRLGIRWKRDGDSILVTYVEAGSPAEAGRLLSGDAIVRFGPWEVADIEDFRTAVLSAESKVQMAIEREGVPMTLDVQLRGGGSRLGLRWRTDEAESGCVILAEVAPGSPAERSQLRAGDRVLQVGGRDFASSAEFRELALSAAAPVELLIERAGRIRTVRLRPLR